jgi:hypothetical protein
VKRKETLIGMMIVFLSAFALGYLSGRTNAAGSPVRTQSEIKRAPDDLEEETRKQKLEPQELQLPEFYTYDRQPGVGEEYTVPAE